MDIVFPGTEFYAGNAKAIADAALADRWHELRGGEITNHVALFPADRIGWTELVELTVAEATGNQVVPFGNSGVMVDIEPDGLSVKYASRDWIFSVGNLAENHLDDLPKSFDLAFNKIYGVSPESELVQSMISPFRDLWAICKISFCEHLDVVEVYLADW